MKTSLKITQQLGMDEMKKVKGGEDYCLSKCLRELEHIEDAPSCYAKCGLAYPG